MLRGLIETTLAEQGVLPRLAMRMSLQLVLKFAARELGDQTTWRAVGGQLHRETEYLEETVGLVERQIVVGLPKLSAAQIESFLEELNSRDPVIARTVLNVALDAAEPLSTGRRYIAEYRRVAQQLKTVDPHIARTLANGTFMARVPREKAMDHFKHFADLFLKFRDDVGFARTVAKAAFRASDPTKAANDFVGTYNAVVSERDRSCRRQRRTAGLGRRGPEEPRACPTTADRLGDECGQVVVGVDDVAPAPPQFEEPGLKGSSALRIRRPDNLLIEAAAHDGTRFVRLAQGFEPYERPFLSW